MAEAGTQGDWLPAGRTRALDGAGDSFYPWMIMSGKIRFNDLLSREQSRIGGRYLMHAEYFLNGGRMYGPPGPQPAAEQLALALRAGEVHPVVLYGLGVCCRELGDEVRAREALLMARALFDASTTPAACAAIEQALESMGAASGPPGAATQAWLIEPFSGGAEHELDVEQQRFRGLTAQALRATLSCGGTRDFFGAAEEAELGDDLGLAVEILEAAVNALAAPNAKALALANAALFLLRDGRPNDALRYAAWAAELGPTHEEVAKMVTHVRKSAPRHPARSATTPRERFGAAIGFDLAAQRFLEISPEARRTCQALGAGADLVEEARRLGEGGQAAQAVELLKLAAGEAATPLERRRALRALARYLFGLGDEESALRVAGLTVGDGGGSLGLAGCRRALEEASRVIAEQRALDMEEQTSPSHQRTARALAPRLARAVEELRARGEDACLLATKLYSDLCAALGKPEEAHEAAELLVQAAVAEGRGRDEGLARTNLADLLLSQERTKEALVELERAGATLEGLPPSQRDPAASWVYLKKARLESEVGRRKAALTSARRAIDLCNGVAQDEAAEIGARARLTAAEILHEMGDDEEVAALIDEASMILPDDAVAVMNLLAAERALRRGPESIDGVAAAFAHLRAVEDSMPGPKMVPSNEVMSQGGMSALRLGSPEASSPDTLLLEARFDRLRQDPAAALKRADTALALAQQRNDRPTVARAELERASALLDLGRPTEGIEASERARQSAERRQDFSMQCEAELVSARAEAALGDLRRSSRRIEAILTEIAGREAEERVVDLRAKLVAQRVENGFAMEGEGAVSDYQDVRRAMLRDGMLAALAELDRRLAKLLLEGQRPGAAVEHALSALDLDMQACLSAKVSALALDMREALRVDTELAFAALSADNRPGEAASVIERARSSAVVHGRRYAGSTPGELAESVNRAAEGAAVVAWQVVEKAGPLRCLVHAGGAAGEALSFTSRASIDTLVDALGEIYEEPPSATRGAPMMSLRRGAHAGLKKLHDLLFRTEGEARRLDGSFVRSTTLEAELRGAKALRLLPHGPLELVPFAGLVVSDAPSTYLVDRFDLVILPYLPGADGPAEAPQSSAVGALVVGDTNPHQRPLPGAQHECTSIAALLAEAWTKSAVEAQIGHSVDAAALLGGAARRSVLHIAAHAAFDLDAPFASGIDLGGGETLRLDRIATSGLAFDTVVLSGCDTSAADLRRTLSSLSIAGAFVGGGAARAIGSLWAVSDADAPEIMLSLYRGVLRGEPWSRALSLALRAAAHRDGRGGEVPRGSLGGGRSTATRAADPYLWAGFRCVEAP